MKKRLIRWLLTVILGKDRMYVVSTALYKAQKEAELFGNFGRSWYIGTIIEIFDA